MSFESGVSSVDPGDVGYDISGNEIYPGDKLCVAHVENWQGKKNYRLLQDNRAQLYRHTYDSRQRHQFKWANVTELSFKCYLNYLKTSNEAHYRKANSEYRPH